MTLDEFVVSYHAALGFIVRGDAGPLKALYSRHGDVTLANPWGPACLGWADVSEALDRAAAQFRDGSPQSRPHEELTTFHGPDLACRVENERWQAKVSGRDEVTPFELRVTTVFRLEDAEWKVVHRHADTVTVPTPEGVLRGSR